MSWIISNAYLSQEQQNNNVREMYRFLSSIGWQLSPICAVAGNFSKESTLNPGIWQSLDEGNTSLGLGLGQWTPATKLLNWASESGLNWADGDNQCRFLDENSGQWHTTGNPAAPNSEPLLSWNEFKSSTGDVTQLTSYFYYWWEDPSYSDTTLDSRKSAAVAFYELLMNEPGPGPGPQPEPWKHGSLPVWAMTRKFL